MSVQQPDIGEWYRLRDGESFEVVAVDQDAGTIEVQHFDGTVEEFDREDWLAQRAIGVIEDAEPPEDWSGTGTLGDTDSDEDPTGPGNGAQGGASSMAGDFEGLDLFE